MQKKDISKCVALFLFLLAFAASPLMAQSQNISGTVVDESGGVIPGATVQITDVAKGTLARETSTDEAGLFRAVNIIPGRYLIAVEKTGFKKTELTVTLDVNAKLDVGQIRLSVGQVTEVLSVSETVIPLVTTNTMEKAYLVDVKQVAQLPMNGRNWVALMSTVPGMTSSARNDFDVNFNDVSTFHSLGGRGSQNNFILDGTPNLDVGDNQSQYTQPSIDSISEFRVLQSGFNAEYGRNSGMVVAVQSKSGSSSFHGTLYEYFRNNKLDAKCVLCNTLQPQLRYNQFGGNISGWAPIPKVSTRSDKKVFFFYNREMTRRVQPRSDSREIPNANIMNGDFRELMTSTKMEWAPQFYTGTVFQPGTIVRDGAGHITDGVPFANNTVPKSMWQPLSANLLKVYTGLPGYANAMAAANSSPGYVRYYYNNPSRLIKNQDLLRIDYAINSRMNTYFRWVNDYQREQNQNGIWAGQNLPLQPQRRPKPGSSWSWTLINIFSPTISSETTLSYNHQSQSLSIIEPNPLDRDTLGANWTQLYSRTNLTNSVADVQASQISWNIGDPGWHNDGKDYALIENLSVLRGSHNFKFGFYYNRDNKKQTATWPMNGSIDFRPNASMPLDTGTGLANLMLGNFSNYSQNNAHVYPYFRFLAYEAYAQDSWKINRRLTIEYGVRFEHMVPTFTYTRSGDEFGEGTWKLYSVDLSKYDFTKQPTINLDTGKLVGNPMQVLSPLGLICDPCDGIPRGLSPTKNLFAPRIGFAYDVFGDAKMALRAGFGIFHERLRQNNFNFGAGGSWPNLTSASQINGNVANIDLSVTQGTPEIAPPGKVIWPTDNTVPSIYSWYAGIQRELPSRFSLDVSYSGNHAVHLMNQRQVNALPANTFVLYPDLSKSVNFRNDALRPYVGWGSLNAVETLAYSSYNAMMVRVGRRFANNFAMNFNYTWSRIMDLVDNDSDAIINPFDMRQNWGPAGYDQTNVISFDFIYTLPKVKGGLDKPFLRTILNGWELSGIARSQSGQPISVSGNGSTQGVDAGSQYVDVVGDPYAGSNSNRWINPDAFRRAAEGSYGNFHRNSLRLPGVRNLDANLVKNFTITESMRAAFRFEVFNVFNNAQIWGINTSFSGDNPGGPISTSNKNFGQPTSANDHFREARIIQMALRFSF